MSDETNEGYPTMWLRPSSSCVVRHLTPVGCALALTQLVLSSGANALPPAPQHGLISNVVRIQNPSAKLAGGWSSKSGEQFEIKHADEMVEMSFSGPSPTARKGKISGNFDGVVFAGAYEATEGRAMDRGVVRFLLKPDGTLEGSWRSLVNNRQGTWSLSKK